jgi:hypothetical protein
MTTQYTPTLKLALPVTGELSGTWGDVVNDNITSMIEQAIAGLSTINTWTGNAHTLTTANGTTSESRCAMLVAATGAGGTALTGAGEIICPAAAKLYVVQNTTAFVVTLKTSAGTGVAVAAGNTAFLFCDATNVNSCVTTIVDGNITGNLTVGGNATINGNTTLGNATSDTITATARFNTDLVPSTDNARDLGSVANSWKDLYIDGTAYLALVDINGGTIDGVSIGASTAATLINVDNLRLDGNTLSSTDTNGNVVIAPNGTGDVQLDADTVRVGDSGAAATLTSNGAGALTVTTGGAADLTLSTNSGTTSGTVVIANGANGNITLTPDGTGDVILSADRVQIGDSNTDTTLTTNGTGNLNLTTNNGTNSGTIQIAQGVNGNITLTPNGTGSVSVPKLVWSNGTTTRVPYLTTGGQFTDSANLTFSGTSLSTTQIDITAQGQLRLQDTTGGEYVALRSPGTLSASYTLTFPADDGTSGQALITDGAGVLSWSTAASGDVYGPGSSTDNAVARFDSTTGKLLQNSVVLIGDTGAVTGVTDLTTTGNTILGDATTDTVQVNGYMGIGGAGNAEEGLRISNSALTGTGQTGIRISAVATSAATSSYRALTTIPSTAAASFTVTNVYGYLAQNTIKGAGSTITNQYGIFINDQTEGTNNYGLQSNVTSGANKWNLYINGSAQNFFAGDVTLGNGATLKIDDQDSITFGTFSAGTTGVLLQGGTSTSFLAYQAGKERMALGTTEAVFNDPGNDVDFRVESDTNANMLFVDAGNSRVGIQTGSPGDVFEIYGNGSGTGVLLNNMGSTNGGRYIYDQSNYFNIGTLSSSGAPYIGYSVRANYGTANSYVSTTAVGVGRAAIDVGAGGTGNVRFWTGGPQTTPSGSAMTDWYTRLTIDPSGNWIQNSNGTGQEVVFNNDTGNQDFRVGSDLNSYMLWVDASADGVNIGDNDTIQGQLNVIKDTGNGNVGTTSLYITTGNTYGTASFPKFLDLNFQGYRDGAGTGGGNKARIRARERTGTSRAGYLETSTMDDDGNLITNTLMTANDIVFNEDSANMDVRFEGNDNAYLFFMDAGNNAINLGTSIVQDSRLNVIARSSGTVSNLGSGGYMAIGVAVPNVVGETGQIGFYNEASTSAFAYCGIGAVMTSGSGVGLADMIFFSKGSGSNVASTDRGRLTSDGLWLFGCTTNSGSLNGLRYTPGSGANTETQLTLVNERTDGGGESFIINRQASDGILIQFRQATTAEGTISVSGTTVSYNGGHLSRWAQTTTAKDESLVKGTVLSNLDEMNVYTDAEGNPIANEQLNKVKVSDVEGDANVAGVFVNWTHDEQHNVDEINMAMTGDMIIRIAQGVIVQRGDLLMSAGNGTAKPQGDDIRRSKTVAKVTSNHVTCTYADGSYCVPCVLMAC